MEIDDKAPVQVYQKHSHRLLKLGSSCEKIGVGRSKFYPLMHAGVLPAPVKIGGSSRWLEDERDAAIERLAAKRDNGAAWCRRQLQCSASTKR